MSLWLTKVYEIVIPAQAGIQTGGLTPDSRFRGNDRYTEAFWDDASEI